MTDNAPKIKAQATAPGTVPIYRSHDTWQEPGEFFMSIGDNAYGGDYTSGGSGSDEPIDRASLRQLGTYSRPSGYRLTSDARQIQRQWMRRVLASNGRVDASGLFH